MTYRRNRTELLLHILHSVKDEPFAKTRIMGLCNTSYVTFEPLLRRLIDLKLVERRYRKIEITELGREILDLYDKINDILMIEYKLGGKLWLG